MNTILEKIIAHKKQELAHRKELFPVKLLEQSIYFDTEVVSLKKYLTLAEKDGIIAEFKRKSPSKGEINTYASVEEVSIGYMQAGASALSVLTDETFFGGGNKDLTEARNYNYCPILRKDFVIHPYQIIEARSIGADAILLIAACLSKKEIKELSRFAHKLGMEVIVEIHSAEELEQVSPEADIIGVNNRNLKDFSVDPQRSLEILPQLPESMVRISESGLNDPRVVAELSLQGVPWVSNR
jgi:indole-3-glycerol phosphate synthase